MPVIKTGLNVSSHERDLVRCDFEVSSKFDELQHTEFGNGTV